MLAPSAQLLSVAMVALMLSGCASNPSSSGASGRQGKQVSEQVRIIRGPQGSVTVLMPVTIEGRGPFTFALDTGASNSLVDTTVAEQVGLPTAGAQQAIGGVGGVERAMPVRISRWNSGPITFPPVTAFAAQLPISRQGGALRGNALRGLVGSDVWSRLGSFTLDYRSSTLTVNT